MFLNSLKGFNSCFPSPLTFRLTWPESHSARQHSCHLCFSPTVRSQVPQRFLEVAVITLREFYGAISKGEDRDPSWKKAIYKMICKLDGDVPAEFKGQRLG